MCYLWYSKILSYLQHLLRSIKLQLSYDAFKGLTLPMSVPRVGYWEKQYRNMPIK